ncbi:MAG: lipocalin family protein [Victivallaceae bacterium]|nr:lipocalin family protein [Victivallaceae bacterium]
MKWFLMFGLGILSCLAGCRSAQSTASIPAVKNFEVEKYLGQWYEIARLPHRFERDMIQVTADYTLREDGKVAVLNAGWRDGKKKEAHGVAHLKGDSDIGELKVSFFWPFYGDYRIIWLEPDYSSAIVTSSTKDYLWILARASMLDKQLLDDYLDKIRLWGFDITKLEYPQENLEVKR